MIDDGCSIWPHLEGNGIWMTDTGKYKQHQHPVLSPTLRHNPQAMKAPRHWWSCFPPV